MSVFAVKYLLNKVMNLHFYYTINYTNYGKHTLEACINEGEKRYIGSHFILNRSISGWRKGFSLCSCPTSQSYKMCVYLYEF